MKLITVGWLALVVMVLTLRHRMLPERSRREHIKNETLGTIADTSQTMHKLKQAIALQIL
jgi:hypothetical protein